MLDFLSCLRRKIYTPLGGYIFYATCVPQHAVSTVIYTFYRLTSEIKVVPGKNRSKELTPKATINLYMLNLP